MTIQIEATDTITTIDGVPCRLWRGFTEKGVECKVFVHLIAVHNSADAGQFEAELQEMPQPQQLRHITLSMIL